MAQFMPEKRGSPLNNPPPEKALALSNKPELETYNLTQVDTIERKRVRSMRRGGKSERGEKGVVIFAILRCYACGGSSRISFYYNEPPPYVMCQGCSQLFPFSSFGCWAHSNLPI
jgi:hypothetical protein